MKTWILLISIFCIQATVFGQQPSTKEKAKKQTPIKKPVLKTTLGIFSDSINIPVEQVKAVLGTSLKVTDNNNNPLTVTYYQFLYRRRAVREDEKTGKVIPTTSIVSDYFTTTPLPEKWVKIIREDLVPGEELYFFDIIAKDKNGTPFYAPNLKIITQ
jgi:hypothetical protein